MQFDDISFVNISAGNTPPTFEAGTTNTLTLTQDVSATDIKAKLLVSDGNGGTDTITVIRYESGYSTPDP
jgi:hypothetical protein